MATISDLANKAAALAAGYVYTSAARTDGTWYCTIEKIQGGAAGDPDDPAFRAYADSFDTQANAEARALTVLNYQRKARYVGSGGVADGTTVTNDEEGHVETVDIT